MINGACLCGECSYQAYGELFDVLHCHCTTCQKLTGSAFATYGGISLTHFRWMCGLSKLKEFHSSEYVSRYFCKHCGSMIAAVDKNEKDTIYLSVGLLDSNTTIEPEYHQYISSKVEWYKISDNLPKYLYGTVD